MTHPKKKPAANRFRFRARKATGEVWIGSLDEILRHDGVPAWLYEYPSIPKDQSTGLLDRNGIEIFEGDIIKGTTYRYGYELHDGKQFDYLGYVGWLGTEHQKYVVHDADTFKMEFGEGEKPTSGASWELSQCVHRNTIDYITGEVIGNIYQHPHLLKP